MNGRCCFLGLLFLAIGTSAQAQPRYRMLSAPFSDCANGNCNQQQQWYYVTVPTQTQTQAGCNCAGTNCPEDCAANGCTCTVQWTDVPGQPDQKAKLVNGVWVGNWSESLGYFRPRSQAGVWGEAISKRPAALPAKTDAVASTAAPVTQKPTEAAKTAPATAPVPPIGTPKIGQDAIPATPVTKTGELPTGMDMWKQADAERQANTKTKFTIGGESVTEELAYNALGSPAGVPTDRDQDWILYFSKDPSRRDRMRRDFADSAALAPYREKYRFKVQDPSDPNLVDRDGKSSPYADPDGGLWVVHANGVPVGKLDSEDLETVEDVVGALQVVDPTFNADAVRNLAKSSPIQVDDDYTAIYVVAGVLLLLVIGLFVFAVLGGLAYFLTSGGEIDAPVVVEASHDLSFAYSPD